VTPGKTVIGILAALIATESFYVIHKVDIIRKLHPVLGQGMEVAASLVARRRPLRAIPRTNDLSPVVGSDHQMVPGAASNRTGKAAKTLGSR
jgi:hypothetical protein